MFYYFRAIYRLSLFFFYKTSPKSSFWQCRLGLRPYRYRRISVWQVLMLPPSVSDSVREGPLGNPPRGTWLDCQVNDDTDDSKRFVCTCISIKNEEKVKKKKGFGSQKLLDFFIFFYTICSNQRLPFDQVRRYFC